MIVGNGSYVAFFNIMLQKIAFLIHVSFAEEGVVWMRTALAVVSVAVF